MKNRIITALFIAVSLTASAAAENIAPGFYDAEAFDYSDPFFNEIDEEELTGEDEEWDDSWDFTCDDFDDDGGADVAPARQSRTVRGMVASIIRFIRLFRI